VLYLEARINGQSLRWPLAAGVVHAGRDPSCEIVIDDPAVSGRHLKLEVRGRSLHVEDLGSMNGLWVEGQRVAAATVRPDDWFVAGRVLLALREGISFATAPPDGPGMRAAAGRPARARTPPLHDGGADTWPPADARPHESAAGLAELLARAPDRDALAASLLARVAAAGSARGAALLAREHGHWSVAAAWGEALPSAVEALLADWSESGVQPMAPAGVLLRELIDGRHATVLYAHPWTEGPAAENEVLLLGQLLRWLFDGPDADAEPAVLVPSLDAPAEMPEFIFASDACRQLLQEVDRLAASPLAVLLVGETGTGKELLARRIHMLSPRRAGPFVAINCSAVPSELLEAELFGIEKGVATGVGERTGRLLQASGGTILLDEIGDLPSPLQPKLLRALESGEVLPVGAPRAVKIDVRIVSATHRDLHGEADRGVFRRDLLYRIAGAVVRVPPLRERPEDVLPLARAFARQAAAVQGHPFRGIDLQAARLLAGYAWPGNVRELRHAIARAVALADGPVLHPSLLPPEITGRGNPAMGGMLLGIEGSWREARQGFDRIYFARLLERCGGNLTEAARLAGLARSNLYRKLQELRLH
jgi:DNA-binding NtrC family response regulator